jgi:YidC/Oxa1 family membrane protein insertase
MEKRIFVAIAVSIAFLWLWAALAPRLFPELAPKPAVKEGQKPRVEGQGTTAPTVTATAATETAAASPSALSPQPSAAPVPAVAASNIQYTTVDTGDYTARFSNRGAQLVSFQLKKHRMRSGAPVELVKSRAMSRTDFPFAIESADAALARELNSALYQVNDLTERGSRIIQYRYASSEGVRATKTFRFNPNEYLFDVSIEVAPAKPYRVVVGPGIRNLEQHELDNPALILGNGVVQIDGDLDIVQREKGDRLSIYQTPEFVGIEDNYFLTAIKPGRGAEGILRRVDVPANGKGVRKELYAGLNATPSGAVAGSAFFGPKETEVVDRYGLSAVLQYGMFGVIARFLLTMLVWINQYTLNFGFAIIVLTIIIKVVLYPLQHKSIVSMKKMQKVQPKMEAIKNKYKKAKTDPEQRQKMNMEMMKLYQVEGINPMSGCLPILLQLPILWGFYNLLSRAIELRGAPFILWITDLSEKDPYYITPILMTVTMFLQTWLTPMTGDPMQRRIFLIMPIFFGYFFKEMPSGLVLYWLVQNILTIIQQLIMNKWWKDHPDDLKKA